MSEAKDRSLTRRTALQSAVVLAACGFANADTAIPQTNKPKSRDSVWIPSTSNQFLSAALHRPAEITNKRPAALLLHDLRGSKVQPHRMPVTLAESLAAAGHIALRVDLLGRGDSEGNSLDATPQRDLENARHALAALQALPDVDPHDITLIGLSYGGILASCLAAESIAIKRIVLISSCPVDNDNHAPTFKDIEGKQVSDQLGNLISKDFYDAFADLTPLTQLRKNRQTVLMVYGTHDAEIRSDDYETCKSELTFADVNTKSIKIEGADHAFASHDHESQAIEAIINWLRRIG